MNKQTEKMVFWVHLNGNPWVRGLRVLVFGGLAAAAAYGVQALPGIDWPGSYDAMIVMVGTGVLTAFDKALRGADSGPSGGNPLNLDRENGQWFNGNAVGLFAFVIVVLFVAWLMIRADILRVP